MFGSYKTLDEIPRLTPEQIKEEKERIQERGMFRMRRIQELEDEGIPPRYAWLQAAQEIKEKFPEPY
jgi:hypothetical protein